TNVLIHVINCLLFFKFLLLIVTRGFAPLHKTQSQIIFLSAVIFAVHPIHTEAVAWVSGRTDSLSFTFFIAAFIFYLRYEETRANSNLSLTALMYLLSLLAKEMAITFPVLIFLYDVIVKKFRLPQLKKNFGIYTGLLAI